jgi:cytokinesis protein
MDALLEKLRAAAPQTKDTRDRRRRARLKDRHQVRVASGQKIPETGENVDENGMLAPSSTTDAHDTPAEDAISEGEDIADRAASLLQGLRGEGENEGGAKDDSIRVRRRRESADEERNRRRARRRAAGTSTENAGQSTITEEAEGEIDGDTSVIVDESGFIGSDDGDRVFSPKLTTVVVPPSPTVLHTRMDTRMDSNAQ